MKKDKIRHDFRRQNHSLCVTIFLMQYTDSRLSELMIQVQSGNSSAYEEVLEAAASLTTRFLQRQNIPVIDQDDIVQDVLLGIHNAKKTYTPHNSCLAWIYAIVRFKLADFFRRKYRFNQHEIQDDLDSFLYEDSIERSIETAELRESLNKALDELTPIQRSVVTKMKFEGYSIKEVAAQLGISESNVKINAFRGYKKLHDILSKSREFVLRIFLLGITDYLVNEFIKRI